MYCRTDIGGVYRFDYPNQEWVSLIDHVGEDDLRETCPISVALDPARPSRLFIASGLRDPDSHGCLTISDDYGATFLKRELPFFVHGNLHGRGTGERLLFDPAPLPEGGGSAGAGGSRLWMASQLEGLWRSDDLGESWQRVATFPETACTFVSRIGSCLLVGTEGLARREADRRGHSLYFSLDDGATWQPVPQPAYVPVEGSKLHGLVAQRCATDGTHLYVTFSANGPRSQNVERGYTCDSGDCSCGRIARYALTPTGPADMTDITPEKGNWGFSAISAEHGLLVSATIHRQHCVGHHRGQAPALATRGDSKESLALVGHEPDLCGGDAIYLSRDHGATWTTILHGLHTGRMAFRLSYMKPEYNGGRNLIHWLTGLAIAPHRPDVAWFNTGTGVFRTQNLQDDTVVWSDHCDGIEETVHINCHAPATGRVQLLDMVGDLGGFAFTDVNAHCENSFANARGDRWITCLSCDWPDADPAHIVVTARGNWTGKTQGGLIVTRDGAQTWQRLDMPFGLTQELDALLSKISGVNTNAGWVAVSADGTAYVWALADRIFLHARNVLVSPDAGKTFRRSQILDAQGQPAQGMMKPIADRCAPRLFYGFGDRGELYVSTDGGLTFRERPAPLGWPAAHFAKVDCADQTEIRAASGQMGDLYVATGQESGGQGGLWKLHYDESADAFTGRPLTAPGDRVHCVGVGLGRPGGDYFTEPKALYFAGHVGGEYGFWCTFDEGRTIQRLNTPNQMYGRIHSIDGDKRVFGRFYLATGSSGLLYGEPAQ
ncbi:MAG: endoglucanase [Clostridia bacterium]|nr:endoglucanase [Clostridia bacterium]